MDKETQQQFQKIDHKQIAQTVKYIQFQNNFNNEENKQRDVSSQEDHDENQNKQSQQIYLLDPHQYLQYCLGNKKIKVMDERNPILNNVYLKDISLHKKGPLQDKIYSKNNMFYCNIRRGNTLCQIYHDKKNEDGGQQTQLFMCRRGMKKFYDLQPEYLKINRQLTYQHERYRRRIFQKLDQQLAKGNKLIHLYGLFKQNGEHCQVSYINRLGYWLFASKNVAILAKNQTDLEKNYEKQRFYWAKLIGVQFFKILSKFTEQQKQQFKKDIQGKTLLGEHCGYEQHQHITKYKQIQLIFYALVQNNGTNHCLPVNQCEKFLTKYGLKMSRMEKIQGLKEKNKVYENMYKMMKKIGEGTMQQNGEGTVLYIVSEDNEGNQKTVGMCKLKTCQYLIFRKMRQMIKIFFAKKGGTANNFEKFKFQIESLVNSYFKPPKQLEYYYQIAEQAFRQVKKNGKDFSDDQFRYKFVNFLQNIENKTKMNKQLNNVNSKPKQIIRIILVTPPLLEQQSSKLQKLCKKQNYTIDYAYRQNPSQKLIKSVINILHMVPRINLDQVQANTIIITYDITKQKKIKIVQQLQNTKDMKKAHLITFIKSENKLKTIQLLKQKIIGFEKSCDQKSKQGKIQYISAKNIQTILQIVENQGLLTNKKQIMMENNNKQQQTQQVQNIYKNKGITYVIITLLIPGSGKSTLAQALSAQNQQIQIISSDKIRQSIMQKYKAKHKSNKDKDKASQMQQLYAATKKKGLQKYRQTVKQAIGEQPPQKNENRIIYIDRVFCPTTVLQNLQQIAKPWTKFIILTHTQIPTKLNDYIYPHSITYLLGCIKRSIQRGQHQTLSTNPNQIVKVILKFYQMYRGFTFNKLIRQLEQLNIQHELLCLQFIKESQEDDNLFLKKKVEECLKGISPGHDAPQSGLYTQLIQLIYKYSQHIQRKKTEENQEEKNLMLQQNIQKLLKLCK